MRSIRQHSRPSCRRVHAGNGGDFDAVLRPLNVRFRPGHSEAIRISRAEHVALIIVLLLVCSATIPYLADAAGVGVQPVASAWASILVASVAALGLRRSVIPNRPDLALFALVMISAAVYLLWIAWPSLLPPGSGPDLTHHLVLIDYIERHGTLVHEADAHGLLGEMADYTPGVHVLAVLAGALSRTNGFAAVYPVVAMAVALKLGVFLLTLLRLLSDHPYRRALSLAGIALVLHVLPYSLHSFTRDSFLAQVVSETFAIVMAWALVVWWQQPSRGISIVFGVAGAAVFLAWPMWLGPPVLAFIILMTLRKDVAATARMSHAICAFAPIALVVVLHTLGRTSAVGIVGTSGAVASPSPALLGWWLPSMSVLGLFIAVSDRRYQPLALFVAAIGLQAAVLWLAARQSGADTPYMAIKMTYLMVYALIAGAILPVSVLARARGVAWVTAAVVAVSGLQNLSTEPPLKPVLSRDLWSAGRWARERVAPECVDYLVANADTAYWLHLAIMGNRRASERTVNDITFATQSAFERWLTDDGPPYAIADMSVVPAEIRDRVRVVHSEHSAAVVQRLTATTVQAGGACAMSRAIATF